MRVGVSESVSEGFVPPSLFVTTTQGMQSDYSFPKLTIQYASIHIIHWCFERLLNKYR